VRRGRTRIESRMQNPAPIESASEARTMPPVRLNRRRFLGCSAAAGLALAQGKVGEAAGAADSGVVGLGLIGLGNRGTTLLRAALELPGARVVAVGDAEEKHRRRAQGIAEKAQGTRPEGFERIGQVLERTDVDAVLIALPCDLHARAYCEAIRAGKALYAEKPLAPSLAECDLVIAEAARSPGVPVHVGFQRRSNPRYRAEPRGSAATGRSAATATGWRGASDPATGWSSRRSTSGISSAGSRRDCRRVPTATAGATSSRTSSRTAT